MRTALVVVAAVAVAIGVYVNRQTGGLFTVDWAARDDVVQVQGAPAPAPARPHSTASIDPVTGAEIGSGVPLGEIRTWEQTRIARPRSESLAGAYLSEVQGGLDSPLEQILPQMPDGLIPSRRQSGDRRIFTYAFEDGSRMILTFRPRGGGRGLTLYTVDVED